MAVTIVVHHRGIEGMYKDVVVLQLRMHTVCVLPAIMACRPAPSPDRSFAFALRSTSVRIARRISATPFITNINQR